MLVTLVMLATCFGLLCGIGILFGIVGLLLKFGGKVLGACATILLPIGVIWLGFKIVFAVVPLLFKLVFNDKNKNLFSEKSQYLLKKE